VRGGPAQQAGIRGSDRQITLDDRVIEIGGDIIIGIDGVQVNTFEDILIYIALNTRPGQNVDLTIIRDGGTQNVSLTLQPRPSGTIEFNQP
jgi:S1-C subfamily serine protease